MLLARVDKLGPMALCLTNYDLAPHGKHLAAILAPDETKLRVTHLTFLLNFFDKLNRRVPEGKK